MFVTICTPFLSVLARWLQLQAVQETRGGSGDRGVFPGLASHLPRGQPVGPVRGGRGEDLLPGQQDHGGHLAGGQSVDQEPHPGLPQP